MFARHQPIIAAYARSSPDALARVQTFVYLTVQQPLFMVPRAMKDVDREGIESKFLWGWKRDAYSYIHAHKEAVHRDMLSYYFEGNADPVRQERELLAYGATLPGMGLVKAGFMAQLCFGVAGCIDSNNVHRFQLGREQWLRADSYKAVGPKTKARYLDQYQSMLAVAGGCEALWDDWCIFVHSRGRGNYNSAEHVSQLHVEALGL